MHSVSFPLVSLSSPTTHSSQLLLFSAIIKRTSRTDEGRHCSQTLRSRHHGYTPDDRVVRLQDQQIPVVKKKKNCFWRFRRRFFLFGVFFLSCDPGLSGLRSDTRVVQAHKKKLSPKNKSKEWKAWRFSWHLESRRVKATRWTAVCV